MARILIASLFVCAASAQLPRIGDIHVYGVRKLTAEQILAATHLEPGETVPASRGEIEGRIAAIPGVARVAVQTDCCQGDHAALLIGIIEEGQPAPVFGEEPTGKDTLPASTLKAYRDYRGASGRAELNGVNNDPETRRMEARLPPLAAAHFESLRRALRSSENEEQRQAAATLLAYSLQRKLAVAELLSALQDPDQDVRAYAARALSSLAAMGQKQPALGIHVPAASFLNLLDSAAISDRVESAKALLTLTNRKNPALIDQLRERSITDLAEIARWKVARYSLAPFLLLGRIAEMPEEQVRQLWDNGDLEPVIRKAMDAAAKKSAA